MTTKRYSLVRRRRRNSGNRHKSYIVEYFLNFPTNSQMVSHWKFTGTKLREFCDAATDALDGEHSTVGPFHAQPDGAGIRVDRTYTTRTVHVTFDTTDIEAIIAEADRYLNSMEVQ